MGKRGPKKEPTTLKMAQGTHRPSRDGDPDAEPRPVELTTTPEPPEDLGEAGRAAWERNANVLFQCGLLTMADLDLFREYCEAFDEKSRCIEVVKEQGEYLPTMTGGISQHPAINRRIKAEDKIRRLAAAFGMSPSDRAGLQVDPGKKKGTTTRKRA